MTFAVGRRRVPVSVSVYFAGMAALCFAAGPAWRIGLGLLFAALHEFGHLAAMAAFRAAPKRICLTTAGMRIERAPGLSLNFRQEIAIAFAGPVVSLSLAGLFAVLHFCVLRSAFAIVFDCAALNLGFGLFNLLPVRQLDGGRALYFSLCRRLSEPAASRVCLAASLICLFLAAAGTAFLCLRQGVNLSLVVVVVYLAVCC